MSSKSSVERWVLRLVVGLGCSVAICTVFAIFGETVRRPIRGQDFVHQQWWGLQRPSTLSYRRNFGSDRFEWNWKASLRVFQGGQRVPDEEVLAGMEPVSLRRDSPQADALPNWLMFKGLILEERTSYATHDAMFQKAVQQMQDVEGVELAFGWPFRMIQGTCLVIRGGPNAPGYAVFASAVPIGEDHFVPYGVNWLGLAGNIVVFTGLLMALEFGLYPLLGKWRERRGYCAACAYEMRGLRTCPECGKPRRSEEIN